MKIWKAIEEIDKCNDKKFETIGRNGGKCTIKMIGSYKGYTDVIVIEYINYEKEKESEVLAMNDYTLSYDWTEVVEPVSFEEALEHVRQNHSEEYTNMTHRLFYCRATDKVTTIRLSERTSNYCAIDGDWKRTLPTPF